MTGFLLHNRGTLSDAPTCGDIGDPQGDQIAAAELAVDGQVEKREIPHPLVHLQTHADRPNLLERERGFLTDKLALVPR